MGMNKIYRFEHLGGVWYEKRLKDLLNEYEILKNDDDNYYNVIKEYLELEEEFQEFKKWVKKEVKRREKKAFQEYINNFNCVY